MGDEAFGAEWAVSAVNESRCWGWLMRLGEITDPGRPWTRSAFSEIHGRGREFLAARMRELGLEVRVDMAGNLIGRRSGTDPVARTVMIGSHSDTVVGGGRFDGIAGVIAGLEIAAALAESGVRLRHALEIVDFLAEEPNEFGLSCVGSRGMAGALDADMLARTNRSGVALRDGIAAVRAQVAGLRSQSPESSGRSYAQAAAAAGAARRGGGDALAAADGGIAGRDGGIAGRDGGDAGRDGGDAGRDGGDAGRDGGDARAADGIGVARRDDVAAFFELHIEQGPVLEANARDVGIVTHIAGIRRLALTFKGQAAHAGTTPLGLRQDALVAAARFVLELRGALEALRSMRPFVIGTVGEIHIAPNAPNVVPGEARLVVDLRSDASEALVEWTDRIRSLAEDAVAGSQVLLAQCRLLSATEPTTCAPALAGHLRQAATSLGLQQQDIVSGAGHDAAFLSRIAPAAMLFVPSRGGMSHCAEEWTDSAALAKGVATLLHAVRQFDAE